MAGTIEGISSFGGSVLALVRLPDYTRSLYCPTHVKQALLFTKANHLLFSCLLLAFTPSLLLFRFTQRFPALLTRLAFGSPAKPQFGFTPSHLLTETVLVLVNEESVRFAAALLDIRQATHSGLILRGPLAFRGPPSGRSDWTYS